MRRRNQLPIFTDLRNFPFGSVWIIGDNDIHFPANKKRKPHKTRRVVVVSNNDQINNDPTSLTVTVAPLTGQLKFKDPTDVELFAENENCISKDVIARLTQMQPVLKIDLKKCKGELSEDAKYEIMAMLADYFGMTDEDWDEDEDDVSGNI